MTRSTLILRSLRYYRRTHLGVVAGAALSTAVLIGGLLVGTSVRASLRDMALKRLGKTQLAIARETGLFRSALANDLATQGTQKTAPILLLSGLARTAEGARTAGRIQLLGVDARFWALSPTPPTFSSLADDEVILNNRLATQLGLREGDQLIVRVDRPSPLPRDNPLASTSSLTAALRLTVKTVIGAESLGDFSLNASQIPPYSAFVSLKMLGDKIDSPAHANVILTATPNSDTASAAALEKALASSLQLVDAGLEVTALPHEAGSQLRCTNVFLPATVEATALRLYPEATPVLTYLINNTEAGTNHSAYAFASAITAPWLPDNLASNEILINRWLAEDLQATTGTSVELTFYSLDIGDRLKERTVAFQVRQILPIEGPTADASLTPTFPGLTDAASCRDWDTGIAVDIKRITKRDEAYWDRHRATPKVFLSLTAAQDLWANRFGKLTSLRFTPAMGSPAAIAEALRSALTPADLGFTVAPVREQALTSASQSLDLSSYFIGLSFFVLVAALMLMGLLFVLNVEQRSRQTGTLLALGYRPDQIRRDLFLEGMILALLGVLMGVPLGILYNQSILWALSTIWRGAVGTAGITLHLSLTPILSGAISGAVCAALVLWLATHRQTRQTVRRLHDSAPDVTAKKKDGKRRVLRAFAMMCAIGAFLILASTNPGRGKGAAAAFFSGGSLLLIAALSTLRLFLTALRQSHPTRQLTRFGLSMRQAARRPGRSVTVAALLACGIFLVVAVGANRHDPRHRSEKRSSGTGGFALLGETAVPILTDLNSPSVRKRLDLTGETFEAVSFVQARVRGGEDASCLNLNRVTSPRLIGLPVAALDDRDAFTFTSKGEHLDTEHPWLTLDRRLAPDTIPGIADQTVIQYGLGKKVGDTLEYRDAQGQTLKILLVAGLANSIFQGSILVSDKLLTEYFPNVTGSQLFLVDAPSSKLPTIKQKLTKAFRDNGIELTDTGERLALFSRVENTYLAVFLMLGALGMIIGTAGMAIVVTRNILERRSELALLRATGFSKQAIAHDVLVEHAFLLLAGTLCGAASGLTAVLPALLTPGTQAPITGIVTLILAIIVSGLVWTAIATHLAMRGDLIPALRTE